MSALDLPPEAQRWLDTLANLPPNPEPMPELAARLMRMAREGLSDTPEHEAAVQEYAARWGTGSAGCSVPFDGERFMLEMRFMAMTATQQEALGLIDRVRGKVSDGETLQLTEDMASGVEMSPAERTEFRAVVRAHLFGSAVLH